MLKRKDFEEAQQIIKLVIEKRIRAFVSPSIVHIVGYWTTKAYGSKKAKELLLSLLADITVIDSNHEIRLTALHSRIDDIENALRYYTAIQHKLDAFVSRDAVLKKSAIPSLPIHSMTELLNLF